jgi:hypothetical protein
MAVTRSAKKTSSKRLFVFLGVGITLIVLNFAVPRLFFGGGNDKPTVPSRHTTATTQPVDPTGGSDSTIPSGPSSRNPFQPA